MCSMHKTNQTVSVITPTYNSSKFILETLASIERQSYGDWEAIIVDDNSSDDTVELVKSYIFNKERFRLIQLPNNCGAASARNRAIQAAKGRYLAFLDSDDVWNELKLEKQIQFMQQEDIGFSYTSYDVCDSDLNVVYTRTAPSSVSYRDLLMQCKLGCLTVILDRKKIPKIEMPEIRKRQDLGLWLMIMRENGVEAHSLIEPLAKYRKHRNSLSSNKFEAAIYTWQLYRKFEKLSLPVACYYFLNYAVSNIREKINSRGH